MVRILVVLVLAAAGLLGVLEDPCPTDVGETPGYYSDQDLTGLDTDLQTNLSGLCYDGEDLYAVRNGNTAGSGAHMWRIENPLSSTPAILVEISDTNNLGDAEAVCIVGDYAFVLQENDEDIAVFEKKSLDYVGRTHDLAVIPSGSNSGGEGLCFVSNAALDSLDFRDKDGELAQGASAYGGLFFVGHQNGRIYVYDLDDDSNSSTHIGTYGIKCSPPAEISELTYGWYYQRLLVTRGMVGTTVYNEIQPLGFATEDSTDSGIDRYFTETFVRWVGTDPPTNCVFDLPQWDLEGLAVCIQTGTPNTFRFFLGMDSSSVALVRTDEMNAADFYGHLCTCED